MSFLDISRARSMRVSFGAGEAFSESIREKINQNIEAEAVIVQETDDVGGSPASVPTDKASTPRPSPLSRAGFLSRATFSWVSAMVSKAHKGSLKDDDIPMQTESTNVTSLLTRFMAVWDSELGTSGKEKITVLSCMLKMDRWELYRMMACLTVTVICQILNPVFWMRWLLQAIEKDDENDRKLLYVVAIVVTEAMRSMSVQQYWFLSSLFGGKVRSLMYSLTFHKTARLATTAGYTVGELTNLCTNDAERLFEAGRYCCIPYLAALSLSSILGIGLWMLGPSSLIAFGIILATIPLQLRTARMIGRWRKSAIMETDHRVRTVDEFLSAPKLIKMYTWEQAFTSKINDIRTRERSFLYKSSVLQSLLTAGMFVAPTIASVATFAVHIALGNDLSASDAYAFIALYNTLFLPLSTLPLAMKQLTEAKLGLYRLKQLLLSPAYHAVTATPSGGLDVAVEIKDGAFAWPLGHVSDGAVVIQPASACIRHLNLSLPHGHVLGVCGAVGSGKTSVIMAIAGQMESVGNRGVVAHNGTVALVTQQAWIQSATVRENILFGSAYDASWYDKVVKACCLEADFKILEHGDATVIGERGINISGGQKQRISLARAVYSKSDIVLLDDPLSAVDVHVGKHIFEECIKKTLAGRTVVIATHQLQYLPQCDAVLFMDDGGVCRGPLPFASMKQTSPAFGKFVDVASQSDETDDNTVAPAAPAPKAKLISAGTVVNTESSTDIDDRDVAMYRIVSESIAGIAADYNDDGADDVTDNVSSGATTTSLLKSDESASSITPAEDSKATRTPEGGHQSTTWRTYYIFAQATGGVLAVCIVIIVFPLAMGVRAFSDYWIGHWISQGDGRGNAGDMQDNPDKHTYLGVYVGSAILFLVLQVVKSFFYNRQMLTAASTLHRNLLKRVVRAPMAFFDTTPSGRILTHFSKDLDEIDARLVLLCDQLLTFGSMIALAILVISIIFPLFLGAFIIIFIGFYYIVKYFRPVQKQFKRIEIKSAVPLVSHLGATVTGLATIHAYGKTEEFTSKYLGLLELNASAMSWFFFAASWFAWRLDFVSLFILGITALCCALLSVSVSLAGFAIAYAYSIVGIFQFTSRLQADVSARFFSVQRIVDYTTVVPVEDSDEGALPERSPSRQGTTSAPWPTAGRIEFDDVSMRYRPDLPEVVRGLTLSIASGENVGIVGRTGSGKSTLTLGLFRLLAKHTGRIVIDGQDIAELPLHTVRSALTVIPQDPVLFVGTIRTNLDPFNEFTDAEVWTALEHAHVKPMVDALPSGLGAPVVENGENFSVGERQLFCLTRALLRKTKILILDEATSSVDTNTDQLIQSTIRREFKDCTVLMIAHRLDTVLDCDKVLVMGAGKLLEFDHPDVLRSNPKSSFAQMVDSMEH
eukprot:m.1441308 g.1441308  ORF g.1441308 m.1441308 type:complete len:1389 (-) comp25094_c0_seq49:2097-6263(-)